MTPHLPWPLDVVQGTLHHPRKSATVGMASSNGICRAVKSEAILSMSFVLRAKIRLIPRRMAKTIIHDRGIVIRINPTRFEPADRRNNQRRDPIVAPPP